MPPEPTPPVVGLLLAGGQSSRMGGGDKALRRLGGRTILARILERFGPQVRRLVLNANGDPARFREFGLPVVPDSVEGFAGPLAGVLAGLDWTAEHAPGCALVASAPTDAPFLPRDLVVRMLAAREEGAADIVCASSGGRPHPVVGLWPVALRDDLRRALTVESVRKVDIWTARYELAVAEFPVDPIDPFFNTNRPEDLGVAEEILASTVSVP